MQVKQLICNVMRMAGRPDAAEECEQGGTLSDEVKRMQTAMLLCLNAVVDELARGYFPLRAAEEMTSPDGNYAFSSFARLPCRIVRVTSGGRRVPWKVIPLKLSCASRRIEVEYEYVPERLELGDEFSYPDGAVGEYLVSCGVAAEYLIIAGDVSCAEMWERRYREEIERRLALSPAAGIIPPRRWI